MFLEDAVEQKEIVRNLRAALKDGRIAHAYVFGGPQGAGKKKIAYGFAASLLCSSPRDGYACGSCKDCVQCRGGNHPDLLEIRAVGANVKIEQIRDMQRYMGLKSYRGGAQVCIICAADTMTTQAGNCLLKTLEEPAGKAVFVLVTTTPGALLPTILSRCQQVQFRMPGATEDGECVREALESLKIMQNGDSVVAIEMAEKYAKQSREGISGYLGEMSLFLRDVLVWQETGNAELLRYAGLLGETKEMSRQYSLYCLVKLIEEVEKTAGQIESRAYARLALEVLFLQLIELFKGGRFISESR